MMHIITVETVPVTGEKNPDQVLLSSIFMPIIILVYLTVVPVIQGVTHTLLIFIFS